MARAPTSRSAVIAALIGNVLVAATKAVAAAWTGSSAMWSEAVHSAVDSDNEMLLLHGMHRARRRRATREQSQISVDHRFRDAGTPRI